MDKGSAIRLFIWTTKAMVMRAYSRTGSLIQEVRACIQNSSRYK